MTRETIPAPAPVASSIPRAVCADCGMPITYESFLNAWLHDDDQDGAVAHDGEPSGGFEALFVVLDARTGQHLRDATIAEIARFWAEQPDARVRLGALTWTRTIRLSETTAIDYYAGPGIDATRLAAD